jgi:hypothetical protein
MGRTISNDLKHQIVLNYKVDHLTMQEIATKQQVSIGLVLKVVCLHLLYGQATNPFMGHAGHPSFLEHDDFEYLSAILDVNPGLYLDKMRNKLASEKNLHVSIATTTCALQKLDLTCKSTTRAVAQRDKELWMLWEANMAKYTDPDLFAFLDESAVDLSSAECLFSQSIIRTHCVHHASFVWGIQYSILPALFCDGIIVMDIIEGSVNKERFLASLCEQLVSGFPQLNPYLGKWSAVVLDNWSIHHDEDIHELIVEECGELLWLGVFF